LTYLSSGHSPDFVVVRTHEDVGDTSTHHADDPLIEVLGLGVGDTVLQGSVNHAINALDLLLLGKHRDVVLEGIGDPLALAADVGDTLMAVPVIVVGKSLVDAVIEVLVVREDDVATNIVKLLSSQFLFSPVSFYQERNVRSLRGSHRWKQDHRGSRWSQQSTKMDRSKPIVSLSLYFLQY